MKLYFLRHGISWDRSEWSGSEHDRPLTREGEEKMKLIGDALLKWSVKPDLILTSPLTRAHQTAVIVAATLQARHGMEVDERLGPGFDGEALAEILREHSGLKSLMLVGHEPGLSRAVDSVIGGGSISLKKGGLACVKLDDPLSLKGELTALIPPRILAPEPTISQ